MSDSFEVLFADEDEESRALGEEMLEEEGLEVDTEFSSEDALESVRTNVYDAVVSADLEDVGAIEFLEGVRDFSDVSLFVLADEEDEESARRAVNLRASGYFRRDLQPENEIYGELSNEIRENSFDRTQLIESIMTHDMGNALSRASGYAGLLDARGRDYDRLIEGLKDAESMLNKVKSLKEVDRAETEIVDIGNSLQNAVEDLQTVSAENGVEINYEPQSCLVEAGPLLDTMFYNIIENSVEHSKGVQIDIELEETKDHVNAYISDDGEGLPSHISEDIFSGAGGTGAHIVSGIADRYDIEIGVNTSDNGTKYSIRARKPGERMEKL